MRSLSTLATLLLLLAVVFWAPPAKADCPHGTKVNHPHCDGVEPPAPALAPPVVVDSTGDVGSWLSPELNPTLHERHHQPIAELVQAA